MELMSDLADTLNRANEIAEQVTSLMAGVALDSNVSAHKKIIFAVAIKHQVSPLDITSASRMAHITKARDEVCYTLRERGWSFTAIGRVLGNRDHSTIINAVERHKRRI